MEQMPVIASTPKRIVLTAKEGVYAGIPRILGTTELLLQPGETPADLPGFITPVNFGSHIGACSLKRVYPRMAWYEEYLPPVEDTGDVSALPPPRAI